jgi:hypothetical protein
MKRSAKIRKRTRHVHALESCRPSLDILEERLQPGEALFSALANTALVGVSRAVAERPAPTRAMALTERLAAIPSPVAPVQVSTLSENHSAGSDGRDGHLRLFRTDAAASPVPGISTPCLEGPLAVSWVADLLAEADPFGDTSGTNRPLTAFFHEWLLTFTTPVDGPAAAPVAAPPSSNTFPPETPVEAPTPAVPNLVIPPDLRGPGQPPGTPPGPPPVPGGQVPNIRLFRE